MDSISLYQAISEMKRLTEGKQSFSFIHATYNRETRSTDGIRNVKNARLRSKTTNEEIVYSDHKLFYYDIDQQLPRNCWQPLIMFFNGKKVILT